MDINDEIVKGNDAKRIIDSPIYQEAIKGVRDNLVNNMAKSPLGDVETHHRLVIALQVLDSITKSMNDIMLTGQMAEIQLKDKRKLWG